MEWRPYSCSIIKFAGIYGSLQFVSVRACACVFEREGEREIERVGERERDRERVGARGRDRERVGERERDRERVGERERDRDRERERRERGREISVV